MENITKLIERVKREYNVDESRTYITGISDGGTGVYFFAMRHATPWSACMPLNGHPLVIANPDTGADGQLYVGNLVNCPLHIVNGGKDPLYPAASVEPLVAMFTRAGVPHEFKVYPDAGHDVSWWPQERAKFQEVYEGVDRVYKLARQFKLKTAFGTDVLFSSDLAARQGALLASLTQWYTPAETLVMATAANGELLKLSGKRSPYPGDLGVVREGALADLLLVDGNPLDNLKLITDPARNFVVIMKDGTVYKNLLTPGASSARAQ